MVVTVSVPRESPYKLVLRHPHCLGRLRESLERVASEARATLGLQVVK